MPEQLTPEVIDQTPDVTLADVTDQDALLMDYAAILEATPRWDFGYRSGWDTAFLWRFVVVCFFPSEGQRIQLLPY